ncbi:MAG: right-handed parallel beta-helix repeat-containing protein [Candidatus Omnitrophica bacterium]|nr:right-handed parallel beta-helix repeat-containing protein [Candidatus Omnitrophota bacterium]
MKSQRHPTKVIESLVGIVLFAALALPVDAQSVARVTPMDFGAVGNGFIDDSTAVQEALNSGQIIELVSGKYKITQSLQIPTGGGIQGPGTLIHAFDLLPPATPDTSHAVLVSSGNDILLENFRIAKQFADGSYSNGVVFQNGEGLRIKNLEISGYSARYGIHLIEVSNFEVSGCYIHDFRMNASADMIEDSPAGLRVTRSHNGTISGNRILKIEVGSTGRASISPIRPDYGPQGYQSDCMTIQECEGVTIEGNVCITSGEGVDLLLSKSCILTGNVISDTWLGGVKMLGVSFSNVSDNHISDAYQGIQLAYHQNFSAEASGNTVNGNVLQNIGSPGTFGVPGDQRGPIGVYGIHIFNGGFEDGCRYNIVSDNSIVDLQAVKTTEAGVQNDGGPTNLVTDNLFTDQLTEN